jgi:hypothetical protein
MGRRPGLLCRGAASFVLPPPPRAHVHGRGSTPWGRQRAIRRLNSVRTFRGWMGPARGEFLATNSPLGPPSVLHGGFCVPDRARNPLGLSESRRCMVCTIVHYPPSGGSMVGLEHPFKTVSAGGHCENAEFTTSRPERHRRHATPLDFGTCLGPATQTMPERRVTPVRAHPACRSAKAMQHGAAKPADEHLAEIAHDRNCGTSCKMQAQKLSCIGFASRLSVERPYALTTQ